MSVVLLLLEPEIPAAQSLRPTLQHQGYQIDTAASIEQAMQLVTERWPNAMVCHHPEPGLAPSTLAAHLDKTGLDIPCLLVGTHHPPAQVAPPLVVVDSTKELPETLKNHLDTERFVRFGPMVFDIKHRAVLRQPEIHRLTPKLYRLFHLLVSHEGKIVSRRHIMNEVWETDYMGDTRTLDVHIRWMREKIEDNPSKPRYLCTVRGKGYTFIASPDA